MIKQKWLVRIEDKEITVEYKCSLFLGKTVLVVDGDSFTVKGKPLGIGLARRESVIIGGAQAVLDVKKGGRAELVVRDGEVERL